MIIFCLDCWNRYVIRNEEPLTEDDVILENHECEICEQYKPCVMSITRYYKNWKKLSK